MMSAPLSQYVSTFALSFRAISAAPRSLGNLRQPLRQPGWLPEWPMGADCKSAGNAYSSSNLLPATFLQLTLTQ